MPTTSTPSKLSNLIKLDKELAWIGSLESLKLFVQSDLNIEGQWSSPGGEVKQFTSENYTMKWYGRKKQKLVITRDDKNESLRENLAKFATLNKVIIHDGKQYGEAEGKRSEGNSNMDVEVIENSWSDDGKYDSDHITANQDDPSSSKIETVVEGGHKFTSCQCYCRDLAFQLKRVERDIQQLKNRAETRDGNENTRLCNTNTCQSEKALLRSNLEEANNTIKDLKAKIMYLEQEKDNLATAMTLQQKDYQTCLNNLNRQNNKSTETSNNYQVGNEKIESHDISSDVIIIGDSIVKSIQPRKLTRKKVHKYTFPGKTADEIEKEISFDNLKSIPSHVIIHVGTNNLPLESATECAQKIEKLAKKTKTQFPYSKIGLSGLTGRQCISLTTETKTSGFLEINDSETWRTVGNNCPTTEEHPQKKKLTDLTYGTASVKSITVPKSGRHTTREIRDYRNFVESDFIEEILQVPWDIACQFDDPNVCWQAWKSIFLEILDRHAPMRCKRIRGTSVPWITSNVKRVNVAMRSAKKVYFRDKIKECSQSRDVKKSWNLINTLLSRNKKSSNVNELHINNSVIVDNKQIADAFNEYFVQIGPKLAAEVCDPTSQFTNSSETQDCSNSYLGPRFVFLKLIKSMSPQVEGNLKSQKLRVWITYLQKYLKYQQI
ncbi:Hypothetical predicted protein [Paramuricea clavata]|uniref:Uncharacterized protein n=1 Tax=Paramuricea clavata TaxID=317549 RepID=A0A7D9EE54_PARCT|nr:Hypothetical predicted protein [Paramuricea clavata]